MTTAPVHWEPPRTTSANPWSTLPLLAGLGRGARCLCPVCGEAKLFRGYLKVVPECPNCMAPVGRVRADDVPPYFTILLVGHLMVPLVLLADHTWMPPLWLEAAIGIPLLVALCLVLLPHVKGATVALMLRLGIMKPDTDE